MEPGSKNLDEADLPPPPPSAAAPLLCANNCGFFGSPATRNLCSKCFHDHLRRAPAIPSAATQEAPAPAGPALEGTRTARNRCAACGRKVGLMGFECRCGGVFCGDHRYSDKHACGYDYRGAARDAIARANPVVRADKVDKI